MYGREFLATADNLAADYDLQITMDQARAKDCVKAAHALIADFDAILQSIPPAQIVAGARQHLQAIGKLGKTP